MPPLSMQEVLQEHLDKKVVKYGRERTAAMMKISETMLDYLRAGSRSKKVDGKLVRQPVWISFQHIEALAQGEGISLADKMKELFLDTAAMELVSSQPAVLSAKHDGEDPRRR